MSLDEANENDVVTEVDDITFVVDKDTADQFGDLNVDFTSGFLGNRFMVNYTGGGHSGSCC